tara:strand:+ start:7196 stop:7339 length:144 start_codon:yes stop_codon:yes gene_type:complete
MSNLISIIVIVFLLTVLFANGKITVGKQDHFLNWNICIAAELNTKDN